MVLKIICFLTVLISSGLSHNAEKIRKAMYNPDLFEGDILGIDPQDRSAIPSEKKRWTNKKVPYVIDESLMPSVSIIYDAFDDYQLNSCLRFVPRTTEANYIRIFPGRGCFAHVGMNGDGEQPVSLGEGCVHKAVVVHELGHTIGFWHEHSRSDRDKYLIIYWDNIQEGMKSQFLLMNPEQNLLLSEFDYDSVMMYGNYAFSKDGKSITIEARNGQKLPEKTEEGLSKKDIERVNKMYKC
ncbi:astacin-like metalloprotease toxin 5 isoform X1 [Parasteatoda tepidariorum]|uniref:astacin-like metalloprotease toxin 5 isoform X1 n=1 Tax=Parasteatoda tepidariorum TaxID=114398 RepID=UPI001C7265CE|nr:astacin-like metalloprotease toxin 5 [Parasteatoda tepidariorum]